MIITVKYFYEPMNENKEQYNKLLIENENRIIYLPTEISVDKRLFALMKDIRNNSERDILAIKNRSFTYCNHIINEIKLNNGFKYDGDKIWLPSEIWIYNPKY